MMSSIDSALNSASTLVTMDFVSKLKPGISSERLMWVGRIVTFIFMILSAIWAPQIDKFPTLWEYLQNALSYIAPPIVALYVIGVFWKRANHKGAVSFNSRWNNWFGFLFPFSKYYRDSKNTFSLYSRHSFHSLFNHNCHCQSFNFSASGRKDKRIHMVDKTI